VPKTNLTNFNNWPGLAKSRYRDNFIILSRHIYHDIFIIISRQRVHVFMITCYHINFPWHTERQFWGKNCRKLAKWVICFAKLLVSLQNEIWRNGEFVLRNSKLISFRVSWNMKRTSFAGNPIFKCTLKVRLHAHHHATLS
jgi:hypothetical protein